MRLTSAVPAWRDLSAWARDVGLQVDHVIDTEGTDAESFEVLNISGSDHRGIFSRFWIPTRRIVIY
jgi:endonuclease/exonuclease/phosphatase (EEP) superfamily protein YafD